jgi:hypothetical protein
VASAGLGQHYFHLISLFMVAGLYLRDALYHAHPLRYFQLCLSGEIFLLWGPLLREDL